MVAVDEGDVRFLPRSTQRAQRKSYKIMGV